MWAIRNKRTKKWLYGTDFDRNGNSCQRTSFERVMIWDELISAELEYTRRRCGKDYKIVLVRIEEVNDEPISSRSS